LGKSHSLKLSVFTNKSFIIFRLFKNCNNLRCLDSKNNKNQKHQRTIQFAHFIDDAKQKRDKALFIILLPKKWMRSVIPQAFLSL